MSLKGNLETFFLNSILQLLSDDQKTGVLQVKNNSKEVKIYFQNGDIVYATGSQRENRLGYHLQSKGTISREKLHECLETGQKEKKALGRVLVEKGYITTEKLEKIIHDQIEEIINDHPNFLSSRQLSGLQKLVGDLPIRQQISLAGERVMMYDILQRIYTDDGDGDGRMTMQGLRAFEFVNAMTGGTNEMEPALVTATKSVVGPVSILTMASRKQMKSKIDALLDETERAFEQPIARYELDLESKLEKLRSRNRFKYALLDLLFPAIESVRISMEQRLARRDAVELAIAIERYRRQNEDWPANTKQLVPSFIENIPFDPVTLDPLRFAIKDDEPIVYSVGNNLIDDGGQIMTDPKSKQPVETFLFGSAKSRRFDGDWVLWPRLGH